MSEAGKNAKMLTVLWVLVYRLHPMAEGGCPSYLHSHAFLHLTVVMFVLHYFMLWHFCGTVHWMYKRVCRTVKLKNKHFIKLFLEE